MRIRYLIQILVFCLLIRSASSQIPGTLSFLTQGTMIRFDDNNNVVFTDIGRTESISITGSGGRTFGHHVHLDGLRDGVKFSADLLSDMAEPLISSQVQKIAYADKDHIWIIARLGHLADKTILFNLATQKVDRDYTGVWMTLSPNLKHVAYFTQAPTHWECYVDGLAIYPSLGAVTLNGGASQQPPFSYGIPPLQWDGDNAVTFTIAEGAAWKGIWDSNDNASNGNQSVHYRITGVGADGPLLATNLRIEQTNLTKHTPTQTLQNYDWSTIHPFTPLFADLFTTQAQRTQSIAVGAQIDCGSMGLFRVIRNTEPFILDAPNVRNSSPLTIPIIGLDSTTTLVAVKPGSSNRFWVVGKSSDLFQKCGLFDPQDGKFVSKFSGTDLTISSDGKHAAYALAVGIHGQYYKVCVCIDDQLVYPQLGSRLLFDNRLALPTNYDQFSREQPTSKLVSGPTWMPNGLLQFTLQENWIESHISNDSSKDLYKVITVRPSDDPAQPVQLVEQKSLNHNEYIASIK